MSSPGAYGAELRTGAGRPGPGRDRADLPEGLHGSAAWIRWTHACTCRPAADRLAAGRRLARGAGPSLAGRSLGGDAAHLVAVPRMRDQQLKATAAIGDREEVQATFLSSADRAGADACPASTRGGANAVDQLDFRRRPCATGGCLAHGRSRRRPCSGWAAKRPAGSALRATPAAALDDGPVCWARAPVYREQLAPAAGPDRRAWTPWWRVRASTRSRVADHPGREGDPGVFGQPPGSDVNADTWRTLSMSPRRWRRPRWTLGRADLRRRRPAGGAGAGGQPLTPRVGDTPALGAARLDWALDPRLSRAAGRTARLALPRPPAATTSCRRPRT